MTPPIIIFPLRSAVHELMLVEEYYCVAGRQLGSGTGFSVHSSVGPASDAQSSKQDKHQQKEYEAHQYGQDGIPGVQLIHRDG